MSTRCPFCERIAAGEVTAANGLAVAFPDAFPLSPGHVLIVPRRHEADFFALTVDEQEAMLDLARSERVRLLHGSAPDGFNLGLNSGEAAGQTIDHAHLHLVPRFTGDTPDPRGGVRWVFPDRARYWEAHE